jgi:hypothetical protein
MWIFALAAKRFGATVENELPNMQLGLCGHYILKVSQ